jgi:undecaprenyl-diphosphatase
MDFLHATLLGVVEGLTEFLPVSSTAHLIFTSAILHLPSTEFLKSFEIAIQLGAILAVLFLYWRRFFLDVDSFSRILAAFLPTAVVGFFLYTLFKGFLMDQLWLIVSALFLGGILLILFEMFHRERADAVDDLSRVSYLQCFLIGVFQSIAIIPGVSRAGATILGGLLLGLKRRTIVEFSFLLAVPTMVAATGYDLLKTGFLFSSEYAWLLGVGFLVSFVTALLAVKFFLRYIQHHSFVWFGVYRILVSLLLVWWMAT